MSRTLAVTCVSHFPPGICAGSVADFKQGDAGAERVWRGFLQLRRWRPKLRTGGVPRARFVEVYGQRSVLVRSSSR